MTLEESRRRMEASLARKRVNVGLANGAAPAEAPQSPATSGAMDSLLEKLRAAAPQTRDTRDRRRRARLKERHQVRVASGQKVPENMAEEGEDEQENGPNEPDTADEPGLLPPQESEAGSTGNEPQVSEGEDVADRAASMLQGLRGDSGGERLRRRRENAEEERRNRRMRRRNGGSKDSADALPSVSEPSSTDGPADNKNEEAQAPSIVVSQTEAPEAPEATTETTDSEPSPPAKPAEPSDA